MGTYKSLSHLFGKPEDSEQGVVRLKKDPKAIQAQGGGDDDEGGSGGQSKGLFGFYKKEKLHNLIRDGKLDAKNHVGFLNKDRLDESSFKESDILDKDGAEKEKADKQTRENASERTTDNTSKKETGRSNWGKTSESFAGSRHVSFADLGNRNEIGSATQASVAVLADAVTGNKQLGTAFTGKEHGNAQGLGQHSWITSSGVDAQAEFARSSIRDGVRTQTNASTTQTSNRFSSFNNHSNASQQRAAASTQQHNEARPTMIHRGK